MSSQEPESSSNYGWRESDGDSKPGGNRKKLIFAVIAMVIIMGSPWWMTAIPQFGFSN
ncbi:MAG: hypothetical protein O3B21_11540 [Proteobacteria bacterium]|nr:hypothetical protein [Pseudomonadota bacterium]MDA1355106.1 hypothetical protein [Pseudomonadota bacterium]